MSVRAVWAVCLLAARALAAGELAAGELAAGELAAGELAAGELAAGELKEAPRCAPHTACDLLAGGRSANDNQHTFTLGASSPEHPHTIDILFSNVDFHVKCFNFREALDSPALPQMSTMVHVKLVVLCGCSAPRNRSLVDVLLALNVTLERGGSLQLQELPRSPRLSADHFQGLAGLRTLQLSALGDVHEPLAGFLKPLADLTDLTMFRVRLHRNDLLFAASTLVKLQLTDTGVRDVPFENLTSLLTLVLDEDEVGELQIPSYLRQLTLRSSNNTRPVDGVADMEKLKLSKWLVLQPEPLARCERLRRLELTFPAAHVLPRGWVARCPRLERLSVDHALALKWLPEGLLENATKLVRLYLMNGALQTLPDGLLADALHLKYLNLNGNQLKAISRSQLDDAS